MKQYVMVLLMTISITLSGCTIYLDNGSEIVNESGYEKTYELEDQEDVDELNIDCVLGIGEFSIKGGSEKLVDAQFEYSNEAWEPQIDNSRVGRIQNVDMKNPSVNLNSLNNYKYNWKLELSKIKPVSLDLDLGIGEGELDFREVNLKNLNLQMGVGDVTLNLRKNYGKDLDIHIDGGVGKLKVLLPKDIGVKVKINGGLKAVSGKNILMKNDIYYNNSFQTSDYVVELDIAAGIGQIELLVED
ncbi:MAG: toast rack family protein [Tissierellales bacterium]|jgi:hypothetical protein|nr:toast rack family protein [Tissierellales bacterium]